MPAKSSTVTPLRPVARPRRRVTVLGSTGSVGCSTVDLLQRSPDRFETVALVAQSNVATLAEQARALEAELAVIADESRLPELKERLAGTNVAVAGGRQAVIDAAADGADLVVAAIVGAAGLEPTLRAVRRGATVAIANKECLVCAGEIVLRESRQAGATLLPVDSEHNAIFQVFDFARPEMVARIVLTASGGPFRAASREAMRGVTPEQALRHPTWEMGAKISIDSATMMNKGLELIEAWYLFPVAKEKIEVVIHPQSVVHSLVEYVDGSLLAQLGTPDMRTPIAYALAWPERMATPARRLDLAALGQLTFESPDDERFPALRLARRALQSGGAAPTILNAANEVAVQGFLNRRIGFLDIAAVVEGALDEIPSEAPRDLDGVLAADRQAREVAGRLIERLGRA
jgi:1-deoxy-D-xylulose-5-phosphate reductoisomerase